MIKIIGAIFIVGATTWTGFEFSKQLSERPKNLRLFRHSLEALEAEIMFSYTPLGEAADKISAQIPEPIATHYKTFSDKLKQEDAVVKTVWEESLNRIWESTSLKKSEYEILLQFGENLGRHDRDIQQKQILLTLANLEREEENAREKQKKYEKMVKSLGVLTGMLIIILLL